MAKSKLDDRFQQGDGLIDRIRSDELGLLADAHESRKPTLFNHWRGLARAEELVRREYTGRYLFELLQNANDAILDWYEQHPDQRGEQHFNQVRLELTEESLLVANSGLPFRENNIRALCQFGDTTKSASKQIGHKGIGFKSVLEITDKPEVYSDFYAFGFDRQEFVKAVCREVGKDSQEDYPIPVLLAPFRRRLGKLSPYNRERIEWLFDQGYVTVIQLPFKEGIGAEQVEEHMRADLTPPILLFLNAIDQLEIAYLSGKDIAYWREDRRKHSDERSYQVVLYSDEGGEAHVHSQWLMLAPYEVPIENRELIADLGEAWKKVYAVRFAVAFPLDLQGDLKTEGKSQPFYVYFPTEEPSGLPFLIHADYYIETARKDIRRNTFNDWLNEELAIYLTTTGVRELKGWFPRRPELVDILAPVQEPGREFGQHFIENYLALLSDSLFVPLTGGQYKPPRLVRFPPVGADSTLFRRFFPPSLLRGEEKWAFPLPEVEERELNRYRQGHPFLLREELGTCKLDVGDVAAALADGPTVAVDDCAEFFTFLADWWDSLERRARERFVELLSGCRIIPTRSGWRRPDEGMLFQANLRLEQDIDVPEGFEFELVTIEAYSDEKSYRGAQANLLRALGVSDYQRRDILRRAILPVLRTPERFDVLMSEHPTAIYGAYRFLKDYYDEDRSKTDIADDLLKVPVPVSQAGQMALQTWKPAGEVYFSQYWTGSDDLETIYDCFDDAFFLHQVEGLEDFDDEETKKSWYGFFSWLGVAHRPRILEATGPHGWSTIRHSHPFSTRPYWAAYVDAHAEAFDCSNRLKQHGKSRLMERTWALDHFEELAHQGDLAQLRALFRLMGLYWDDYRPSLSTRLYCQHRSTGCPGEIVSSYLKYCLQQTEWVPATIWGQFSPYPLKPIDIWSLGDDAPPEVQRLVPSLPEEFRSETFRAIRADLMKTGFQFEDYLALLKRLPEWYDLHRSDLDESELKKWQKAIGAVFYWIGQALQNGLVRRQDVPECPDDLRVLAFRGEVPCYIGTRSEELVYPDDPFLRQEWAGDLLYLKVDNDWARLREWLGVPNLSDRVRADHRISPDLPAETEIVRRRYDAALPYFLAVVEQTQPSNFDRVFGRLSRLDVHVVEELSVQQAIRDLDLPPKQINERVHLQPRDDPNPRGGRPVRVGDLYITRAEMDNPDILGAYVANYIEIERLSDAFVVLYGRQDDAARWRYLDSRGVTPQIFETVLERLREDGGKADVPSALKELDRKFREDAAAAITFPPARGAPLPPPEVPEPPSTTEETKQPGGGRPIEDEELQYPDLDLDVTIEIETYQPGSGQYTEQPDGPGKTGGGGRTWPGRYYPPSEEVRKAIGRRGERWAYEAERQRLKSLGLDPDEMEKDRRLVWVSDHDPYANHDIKSVDLGPDGRTDIWIEVKSTAGTDRTVEWGMTQFRLAASLGDRYWLYWVSQADCSRPEGPIRFQNPVKLWQDGELGLDFRQLAITLPEDR